MNANVNGETIDFNNDVCFNYTNTLMNMFLAANQMIVNEFDDYDFFDDIDEMFIHYIDPDDDESERELIGGIVYHEFVNDVDYLVNAIIHDANIANDAPVMSIFNAIRVMLTVTN